MRASTLSNTERKEPARVLVVEDHPLLRLGLAHSLATHPKLRQCGEAEGESEAWGLVKSTKPDAVIVDLTLSSGSGLELIKKIARNRPNIRVVVLSMHDKAVYEKRTALAGASAFVSKGSCSDELLSTLVQTLFPPPEVGISEASKDQETDQVTNDITQELTDRELSVFELIGKGLSTRQIAKLQARSIKTIESYRAKIKKKIGVRTSEELVRDAIHWVIEHEAA